MPERILILTVGGSDEPIVTSIRDNKPDYVYFLCSGDSADAQAASYRAVESPGKPCGRITTCQSCGSAKGSTRENIVTQTGLEKSRYTVIKIRQFDDLNDCYISACNVIKEIRSTKPDADIVVDYTGATKSMSAGLAAAAMDDGNVRISIVKGRRTDLHSVKDGTQAARIIDSNRILLEKKLVLMMRFWRSYHYQSCLDTIKEISERPLSANFSNRLDDIRYLCQGFEAWDRFDHKKASDLLKPYKQYFPEHYKFLGEICRVRETWSTHPPETEESHWLKKVKLLTFAPVSDLLLNATRRASQGRFDDAVARLYRALEMFGQLNLLLLDAPLDTSDLATDKLPPCIRETYETRRDPQTGKITLALIQNYTLLSLLEHPTGLTFLKHRSKLLKVLEKRNHSLLAHGNIPVTEQDYKEMSKAVNSFIFECSKTECLPPQFPTDIPSFFTFITPDKG